MSELRQLRALAVSIAEEAAAHVRARRLEVFGAAGAPGHREGSGAVRAKSAPTDPVTVVDTETERLIRARLARERPGDAMLGEEDGGAAATAPGVRWVVDPIDGTVNFMYGIPGYAVSVAAQQDGRTVAGAVVDVTRGLTYSASLGGGASCADATGHQVQLRCSHVDSAAHALIATGFGYSAVRRAAQAAGLAVLLPQVRDIRRFGAAALDLCHVAAGLVDGYYEHGLGPWDWAAAALVAAEAGARVRVPGPDVPAAAGVVVLAAAPGIADEFTQLLAGSGLLDPVPG